MVDGRFFGHFFWKVEGSSAHTRESHATHVCHVQLTCGKLLYGGGEPSRVSRVAINMHVTTIWWRGALTCGSHVSCVTHVAINVHITTIWWSGTLTCGSHVSRVAHVAINMHVTTIWWRGALTCGSRVANVWHVWQLTCTLLLYGGGESSQVAHVHGN